MTRVFASVRPAKRIRALSTVSYWRNSLHTERPSRSHHDYDRAAFSSFSEPPLEDVAGTLSQHLHEYPLAIPQLPCSSALLMISSPQSEESFLMSRPATQIVPQARTWKATVSTLGTILPRMDNTWKATVSTLGTILPRMDNGSSSPPSTMTHGLGDPPPLTMTRNNNHNVLSLSSWAEPTPFSHDPHEDHNNDNDLDDHHSTRKDKSAFKQEEPPSREDDYRPYGDVQQHEHEEMDTLLPSEDWNGTSDWGWQSVRDEQLDSSVDTMDYEGHDVDY